MYSVSVTRINRFRTSLTCAMFLCLPDMVKEEQREIIRSIEKWFSIMLLQIQKKCDSLSIHNLLSMPDYNGYTLFRWARTDFE